MGGGVTQLERGRDRLAKKGIRWRGAQTEVNRSDFIQIPQTCQGGVIREVEGNRWGSGRKVGLDGVSR